MLASEPAIRQQLEFEWAGSSRYCSGDHGAYNLAVAIDPELEAECRKIEQAVVDAVFVTSHVIRISAHATRHTSSVFQPMSHVTLHTSSIFQPMPHVTLHTSSIFQPMPHVARSHDVCHRAHGTRHTAHGTPPGVSCQCSCAQCARIASVASFIFIIRPPPPVLFQQDCQTCISLPCTNR
jgi:hypothetical protein